MWLDVTAALLILVQREQGTPYIAGGDSPAGTDCSGLVSWLANEATGRPVFGDRFATRDMPGALAERGFVDGAQPGALVVGWNYHHAAATLPDGTPVSSGDAGGVLIGGPGAYSPAFDHRMSLPVDGRGLVWLDDM